MTITMMLTLPITTTIDKRVSADDEHDDGHDDDHGRDDGNDDGVGESGIVLLVLSFLHTDKPYDSDVSCNSSTTEECRQIEKLRSSDCYRPQPETCNRYP